MSEELETFLAQVNYARYKTQPEGFYESFFQRANHPTRPLAFWIRYTIFSPKKQPDKAIGELWAIFFNGETQQHVAVKEEYPLDQCLFSPNAFQVHIGEARLSPHQLQGTIQSQDSTITWDLSFHGREQPLLLLPFRLYPAKFPAAKALVALPLAHYDGSLSINGEAINIEDWIGSQNHNWGTRHTDLYAWGQVAGFDTHPGTFLEVATAKLRLGPVWIPPLTPIVLRHNGREYAFNQLSHSIRAHGSFDYFTWHFRSKTTQAEVEGTISAPREAFVGLQYYNPPGGSKHCLNTKIASCTLQFRDKVTDTTETLTTSNRAAFEILTDDRGHGIPLSAVPY